MAKVTNLSRAIDLVKSLPGASRNLVLEKLVDELKVTRSNAFVYLTKANKALGNEMQPKAETKAEKAPKAEKVKKVYFLKKVKVNPITETSPEKITTKVAEIDKVIAGLKAAGATVASPFHNLGV